MSQPSVLRQRGMATLTTGLLLLGILTVLTLLAARVSIFEQRISANEHSAASVTSSAEAGLAAATVRLREFGNVMISEQPGGWRQNGISRWQRCTDGRGACGTVATPLRDAVFHYQFDGRDTLDLGTFQPPSGSVEVRALLCLQLPDTTVGGYRCDPTAAASAQFDGRYWLQLIATASDGVGLASVALTLAARDLGRPPVAAGLTVRDGLLANDRVQIVGNPDGRGQDAPLAIWSNADVRLSSTVRTCSPAQFLASGSPSQHQQVAVCAGCECPAEVDGDSADVLDCESCAGNVPDGPTADYVDRAPFDDLFQYLLGRDRHDWRQLRDMTRSAGQLGSDCSALNAQTRGLVWIDGACRLNGDVGSPDYPVTLIVGGTGPQLSATTPGATVFGLVLLTSAAADQAGVLVDTLTVRGPLQVYGALVADRALRVDGPLTVVYQSEVLSRTAGHSTVLGPIPGSWTDFRAGNL